MDTIKAISIQQPWSSNFLTGDKWAEIRTRRIKPQGEILICSSKKSFFDIGRFQCNNSELWHHKHCSESPCDIYGKAIAIANWYDTVPFTKDLIHAACFDIARWPFGRLEVDLKLKETQVKWLYGYWAWMFKDIHAIEPFPVRGNCGIFNIDYKHVKLKR